MKYNEKYKVNKGKIGVLKFLGGGMNKSE